MFNTNEENLTESNKNKMNVKKFVFFFCLFLFLSFQNCDSNEFKINIFASLLQINAHEIPYKTNGLNAI